MNGIKKAKFLQLDQCKQNIVYTRLQVLKTTPCYEKYFKVSSLVALLVIFEHEMEVGLEYY